MRTWIVILLAVAATSGSAMAGPEIAIRLGSPPPGPGTSWARDLVPLVSVLSTTGIALFTLWQQRRRERLSRRFVPRVDYELDCRFFGPQQGRYIAQLSLKADNKGEVRRVFESLEFRVLGLPADAKPEYWGSGELRAEFPKLIMKDNMIRDPEKHRYYVEPGVSQLFSYTTLVDQAYAFVLVRAKVTRFAEPLPAGAEAPQDRVFTVERVFEVRPTPRLEPDRPGGDPRSV